MEFRDKPMQNLVRIPEKDICKNAQKLLLDGETIVGAYKTVRDQVVFTTHRIIPVDMQGVTGTRQNVTARKPSVWSVKPPNSAESTLTPWRT